jgi:hypothetical protein
LWESGKEGFGGKGCGKGDLLEMGEGMGWGKVWIRDGAMMRQNVRGDKRLRWEWEEIWGREVGNGKARVERRRIMEDSQDEKDGRERWQQRHLRRATIFSGGFGTGLVGGYDLHVFWIAVEPWVDVIGVQCDINAIAKNDGTKDWHIISSHIL